MLGNTQEDVNKLVTLGQSQGERFYSSLLTFDHCMNSMSNWTTTEFNVVKSALTFLTSNHEETRKNITGMWKATNLLGKSIYEEMTNSVNSVKVKLDNLLNITLNENEIINARMDDLTVKSDLYSVQNTINMINTSIAEHAGGINNVNGTIHTALDVVTIKISEVINTRLDNSTVSIHTTMKLMNNSMNERMKNLNRGLIGRIDASINEMKENVNENIKSQLDNVTVQSDIICLETTMDSLNVRMENMNNAISQRIDTAVNLLTKNMNDAVTAMADNVNDQLSTIRNQTTELIDFKDAQLRGVSPSAFVFAKCKQYITPELDNFVWLVSCTQSLDGWLTIQRLIYI